MILHRLNRIKLIQDRRKGINQIVRPTLATTKKSRDVQYLTHDKQLKYNKIYLAMVICHKFQPITFAL